MKYTSTADTPLAYHSFLRYFGLPVGIISASYSLYRTLSIMTGLNGYNGYIVLALLISAVDIALAGMAFIGFFKWKPYAWYSILVLLSLRFMYSIINIFIFDRNVPTYSVAGFQIFRSVISLIVLILVIVYYYKRKLLFFDDQLQQYLLLHQENKPLPNLQLPLETDTATIPCTACGANNKITRVTCQRCGAILCEIKLDENLGCDEGTIDENAGITNDEEKI